MYPCLLSFLFLTELQATPIHKLDVRADICGSLLDCSDLTQSFGTPNLDLSPSSGFLPPGAPNLALSLNTDPDPGLQSSLGNGAPSPIDSNDFGAPQSIQTLDAFTNVGQNAEDVAIIPNVGNNLETLSNRAWDPVHGGWWGTCQIYGVGCVMCYTNAGDVKTTHLCREAVLLGPLEGYPREHNLCLKQTTQICIEHDLASDDTPDQPAPADWGPGEWGYCNKQNKQCTMCWKHETGESTGCMPAVQKTLTSTTLPNPAVWLCYAGEKPSIYKCIKPNRWVHHDF